MEYHSKYTGAEVDALLGKVESGDVGGGGSYDDTELRNELNKKVDKVEGKGLSTNDYTDEDKEKTLILGPHIGNDTEEHQANLSKAVASNACYGRVTIYGESGTYISVGKHGDTYYVDVITHFTGNHFFNPTLKRYRVFNDKWNMEYSICIDSILTSSNLATQSEIDALFDSGTSGDGSTSY